MIASMARLPDTVRIPRTHRAELEDASRPTSSLDSHVSRAPSNEGGTHNDDDNVQLQTRPSGIDTNATTSRQTGAQRLLSQEETLELARRAVKDGIQETKRSLAGNEAVTDVVKPKLTVDLGHSNIVRIPEAVVDLIKDEVERLSLSNNHIFHIPYRFAECSHLRYLNIRANNFREFPKGVYKLPLLEILDLSRNKISKLPDEIKNLSSLRVLSVVQNRLDDLPAGVSNMNKLQILKVAGNPLRHPLRRVLETSEAEMASSSLTDNEKEVAVTAELKRFLRMRQPITTSDFESSSDASEPSYLDTPKPVRRGLSSRFPVIPSPADGGASDLRSPPFPRPPPVPMRSHYRMASGQSVYSSTSMQRPGIQPVPSVNERNRSNSEGIIQSSIASRSRRTNTLRMNPDLGTLEEMRSYRNSHLRGLSYNSVLRTRPSASGTSGSSSSSPSSPRERRRLKDGFVNRMSSLPEHKGEREAAEPIIEGARGILFALFQINSHISSLINVTKRNETRRNSLEIVFYNASTHIERLNEAIEVAEIAPPDDGEAVRVSNEAVQRECDTCLMAYTHVATQLRNCLDKIVAHGDPRYVRSVMLTIYGSLVELRNAYISLGGSASTRKRTSVEGRRPSQRVKETATPELSLHTTTTPNREQSVPMRRFRSDTTIQHSYVQVPSVPQNSVQQSAVSSPGFSAAYNMGGRSRSSSRTLINTSIPLSVATSRSGEAFPPLPNPPASRINPLTGMDEVEEERIFERIFHQLTAAYTAALQAIPLARRQFIRCLEMAEQAREPEEIQMLWNNLIRRCRACLEVSDALGLRLSTMKVKEPGGGMRNQREFWQLCKAFMQSFVDLVTDMRDVRNMQLLPPDIIIILRPVQRASREAGRLVEASPWSFLADMSSGNPQPTPLYGPPLHSQHQHPPQPQHHQLQHHHPSMSTPALSTQSTSSSISVGSPQSVTLPATPLSAALGPAAQATVPSTPASAYSDKFFEGDVFQRADSLLSMPHQAPFFGRR